MTSTKQKVFPKGHHSPSMRIQEYSYPNWPLKEIEYSHRAIVGFVQAHGRTLGTPTVTSTSSCSFSLVLLSLLPFIPIFPILIVFLSLLALFSVSCPLLPFSLGSLGDISPFCYPFLFECLLFVWCNLASALGCHLLCLSRSWNISQRAISTWASKFQRFLLVRLTR